MNKLYNILGYHEYLGDNFEDIIGPLLRGTEGAIWWYDYTNGDSK